MVDRRSSMPTDVAEAKVTCAGLRCERARVCVCVCVRERERERECVCVSE